MAKSSHYRNLWENKDDPSRCDQPVRLITTPDTVQHAPVLLTAPVAVLVPAAVGLHEMARRPACSRITQQNQRSAYTISEYDGVVQAGVRDMLNMTHIGET